MSAPDLWVTSSCASALGIDLWPATSLSKWSGHPVLEKFRVQRSTDPEPAGQQVTGTGGRLFSRHVGRDRGATWFDRANNVVFLVAFGAHESGARGDFYKWVPEAFARGELSPTGEDYDALAISRAEEWIATARSTVGPDLFRVARKAALDGDDRAITANLGRCEVQVRAIAVDSEFMYVLRIDQPKTGSFMPPEHQIVVAEALAEHLGRITTPCFEWDGASLPFGSWAITI